jgi:hypothetical protein
LSDINDTLFNIAQLATWDQARECAAKLSAGPLVVGGGVKPETANRATSGIYIPEWEGGPASFPEPHFFDPVTGLKYYFIHFRFNNGGEGMNAGLVMDRFRRYPNSPYYVLSQLVAEANSIATR